LGLQLERLAAWEAVSGNVEYFDSQLTALKGLAVAMMEVRQKLQQLQLCYTRSAAFGTGAAAGEALISASGGAEGRTWGRRQSRMDLAPVLEGAAGTAAATTYIGSGVVTDDASLSFMALQGLVEGLVQEASGFAVSTTAQSLHLTPSYHPFLQSDWEPVAAALARLPSDDYVYAELELLKEETVVRHYVGAVISFLVELRAHEQDAQLGRLTARLHLEIGGETGANAPQAPSVSNASSTLDRGDFLGRLRSASVDYFFKIQHLSTRDARTCTQSVAQTRSLRLGHSLSHSLASARQLQDRRLWCFFTYCWRTGTLLGNCWIRLIAIGGAVCSRRPCRSSRHPA
jgi:hypothetical protein